MLSTGVIDALQPSVGMDGNTAVEYVGFQPAYGKTVGEVYGLLTATDKIKVQNIGESFASLKSRVDKYSDLEKALLFKAGEITFGRPIIYKAKEKSLQLPDSIKNSMDVYWVDLAFTFRQVTADDLAEMAINYAVPEGWVALELIPLHYGHEVATETRTQSPDISVNVAGVGITVGEFFQRTVAYSYIKPTISAFGLREGKFSWALRDEAVNAGSHSFAAIIGVPKGTARFEVAMSAHVRLKKPSILGMGMGTSATLAGTAPQLFTIDF